MAVNTSSRRPQPVPTARNLVQASQYRDRRTGDSAQSTSSPSPTSRSALERSPSNAHSSDRLQSQPAKRGRAAADLDDEDDNTPDDEGDVEPVDDAEDAVDNSPYVFPSSSAASSSSYNNS